MPARAADPDAASPPAFAVAGDAGVGSSARVEAWDCHVHVFDAAAPVRPGHYTPPHAPLEAIEREAASAGVRRLVIVQPSVYGHDHAVLLRALQAGGGRHRGVAVVAADAADAELDRLHAAGVRGVRFNLVSPAGHAGDAGAEVRALAPRLRERGWHVQWYVRAPDLPRVAEWQAATGLRFVLDHLAGLTPALTDDDPAWTAARALADAGAWLKLSGAYRLDDAPPHDALRPVVKRAAALFGPRLVWGSDWPHTCFADGGAPAYAATLAPFRSALGPTRFDATLRGAPAALYLEGSIPS